MNKKLILTALAGIVLCLPFTAGAQNINRDFAPAEQNVSSTEIPAATEVDARIAAFSIGIIIPKPVVDGIACGQAAKNGDQDNARRAECGVCCFKKGHSPFPPQKDANPNAAFMICGDICFYLGKGPAKD